MMRALFPVLPIAAVALLSACATTSTMNDPGRTSATLPAAVVQSLPRNVPDEAVFRDSDGCYSYRDDTTPPAGFALIIGSDGRQVCDGRFPPPVVVAEEPVA